MAYGKVFRRKRPKWLPQPYRSGLEYNLHVGPLQDLDYEPMKVDYTVAHKYTPDFVNYNKGIMFEAKGRFEDSSEAAKYIHIRDCNPDWELVFIFEKPDVAMPNAKPRKDGTKFSHKQWAEKHHFKWCCPATVNKEWL